MNKIVKGMVVVIVILLILLVGVGAMIRFDVFGLGTQILGPVLKDVPVVNLILPEMPEEADGEGEAYNFQTIEEAVEILKITEKMLKESGEKADELNEQLTQSIAEVERLKVFEDNQRQFEADKAAFDKAIADASTPIEFKTWFEKMSPENAANIYGDVVQEVATAEELKRVIDTYENMKPAEAAAILGGMATTQLDLVSRIISSLTSKQAAQVLGAMEPTTAAKITTYMSPAQ